MAINLKRTSTIATDGIKVLVYGQSGAGKTYIIKTLPNPIIFSAEGGLLSIADSDLPYIPITNSKELYEAYQWVIASEEAKKFQSVVLDSISEIAEVVLNTEKKIQKDGRAAYGAMGDQMTEIIRTFRDIPNKHVYFSAKLEKAQDEMGKILFSPSMPGNKVGQSLPYFFDEVFALRVEKDSNGDTQRVLQCFSDGSWIAKDRSGKLSNWEEPDLGVIIEKISG